MQCLLGGVPGREAELLAHARGVHGAPEAQVPKLRGPDVAQALTGQQPHGQLERLRRHRQRDVPGPPDGLGEREDPLAGDVERPRRGAHRGVQEGVERVLGVQQLDAGVVARQHRGDRRRQQLPEHRGFGQSEDRGDPQDRHLDVRPFAGHPAHVTLDRQVVQGDAAARLAAGRHVLGEHGRVHARGAVDGGRGDQHEPLDGRGPPTGRDHVHRAHDVGLLDGRTAARGEIGVVQSGVDDGVDAGIAQDALEARRLRVEADELGVPHPTAVLRRRFDGVDGQDALDGFGPEQHPHEVGAEVPAPAHDGDSPGGPTG